ncbi:transposable element Tcb2 transposase [Trichonephila clavipes]|nr:transposable element Tcb2 transposase [Trichonephila clavipes]
MRKYAGRRNGGVSGSKKHVVGVRSVFLANEIARRKAVKINRVFLSIVANNQSVRRHLDAFTLGRIIGKLDEGLCDQSHVAAEFGVAHSIVSRLWRQFQTTGTAIRGFNSGRPRGTTAADDRYIVLQAKRNKRQTVGEIAKHTTQATRQPISRFTVARRLHGSGLFAQRPADAAARTLPPVTIWELRLALQDEWAAMPQQLIDTLILSMGRRCETCLAVREIKSPTKDRMFLAGHPSQGCFGLQSHCAPC